MALKSSRSLLFVTLLIVMLAVADYAPAASAAEQLRPQRRRRPSPAVETDLDGAALTSSPAPRLLPSLNQRRSKLASNNNGKPSPSHQWDIAESCKSEPGCDWTCSYDDAYECTCRCRFDPLVAFRYPSHYLSPR